MGKRKAKTGVKVPKRIAGVKIPKAVRKGPIGDFLNSSGGQVLIAEALLLVAGAYAAKRVDPDSPVGEFIQHPVEKAKELALSGKGSAKRAGNGVADASTRLAYAFSQGLRAFRAALAEPLPPEVRERNLEDRESMEELMAGEPNDHVTADPNALGDAAQKKRSAPRNEEISTPT